MILSVMMIYIEGKYHERRYHLRLVSDICWSRTCIGQLLNVFPKADIFSVGDFLPDNHLEKLIFKIISKLIIL